MLHAFSHPQLAAVATSAMPLSTSWLPPLPLVQIITLITTHIITHIITLIITHIITYIITQIITQIITLIITHIITLIITLIITHIITHISDLPPIILPIACCGSLDTTSTAAAPGPVREGE